MPQRCLVRWPGLMVRPDKPVEEKDRHSIGCPIQGKFQRPPIPELDHLACTCGHGYLNSIPKSLFFHHTLQVNLIRTRLLCY
jgi:hypothetical protein